MFNNNNDTWCETLFQVRFRGTSPPGEAVPPDYYYIGINTRILISALVRYEGGQQAEILRHDLYTDIWNQLDPLAWNWFRVTWWSVAGVGLIVRFEVKINNAWYKLCDDFEGVTDVYTDKTYNRVGLYFSWHSGANPQYIDNIRIYKAI